jgi:hypothetical protein
MIALMGAFFTGLERRASTSLAATRRRRRLARALGRLPGDTASKTENLEEGQMITITSSRRWATSRREWLQIT